MLSAGIVDSAARVAALPTRTQTSDRTTALSQVHLERPTELSRGASRRRLLLVLPEQASNSTGVFNQIRAYGGNLKITDTRIFSWDRPNNNFDLNPYDNRR